MIREYLLGLELKGQKTNLDKLKRSEHDLGLIKSLLFDNLIVLNYDYFNQTLSYYTIRDVTEKIIECIITSFNFPNIDIKSFLCECLKKKYTLSTIACLCFLIEKLEGKKIINKLYMELYNILFVPNEVILVNGWYGKDNEIIRLDRGDKDLFLPVLKEIDSIFRLGVQNEDKT